MLKNFVIFLSSISLAIVILGISIFSAASVKYAFSQSPSPAPATNGKIADVNYFLPTPGRILPDSIFWPIKAIRDRIWLTVTLDPAKKADIELLLADKRLADAKALFDEGKPDLGISVAAKAEKYLESADKEEVIAKSEGMDTKDFLQRFTLATEKHRLVLDQILAIAPEDAKPLVVKIEDYPKHLYSQAKSGLLEAGLPVPTNPFQEN